MGHAETPNLVWRLQMWSWKTDRSWCKLRILRKVSSPGSLSVVLSQERKVKISPCSFLFGFRLAGGKKNVWTSSLGVSIMVKIFFMSTFLLIPFLSEMVIVFFASVFCNICCKVANHRPDEVFLSLCSVLRVWFCDRIFSLVSASQKVQVLACIWWPTK